VCFDETSNDEVQVIYLRSACRGLAIAITKFVAAAVTRSSAMIYVIKDIQEKFPRVKQILIEPA